MTPADLKHLKESEDMVEFQAATKGFLLPEISTRIRNKEDGAY